MQKMFQVLSRIPAKRISKNSEGTKSSITYSPFNFSSERHSSSQQLNANGPKEKRSDAKRVIGPPEFECVHLRVEASIRKGD